MLVVIAPILGPSGIYVGYEWILRRFRTTFGGKDTSTLSTSQTKSVGRHARGNIDQTIAGGATCTNARRTQKARDERYHGNLLLQDVQKAMLNRAEYVVKQERIKNSEAQNAGSLSCSPGLPYHRTEMPEGT